MITLIVTGLVCLGVGFGVGRIKNAKKLAAIKTELDAAGASFQNDANAVVAAIRKHL